MSKPIKHHKGWRARWTDEHQRRRSKTLPTEKAAKLELKRQQIAVDERKLGLRPPETEQRLFKQAADYWEINRAPQKRSCKDDLSMLKQLREQFSNVPLNEPSAWIIAVDRYRALKVKLSDKTVANHLTLLGSTLRLAHDLGWMDRLPRIKKPPVRLVSTDYSYLRNDEEIARFLRAAREEGEIVFMLYATAVYTGMRAGELAALEWSDIDWANRLIRVQRSFDGPTKNDKVRYVPILDALLPLLRQWRLRHPGRLVFTNRDGRMFGRSGRVFQEVLHRVLDRAQFPKIKRNGRDRRYIVFHDTRHTFASSWVMKGGDLFKLQKILGHGSIAMTLRYAHLQPSAFKEDYGRLGAALDDVGTLRDLHGSSAVS